MYRFIITYTTSVLKSAHDEGNWKSREQETRLGMGNDIVRAETRERERDLGLIESLFTTITRDDLQLTVILSTKID